MFIIHCRCHFCGLTKESECLAPNVAGHIGPQGLRIPEEWGHLRIYKGGVTHTTSTICQGCIQKLWDNGKANPNGPAVPQV